MMFRRLCLNISFVALGTISHAQERDLGLWGGATLEWEVTNELSLDLAPEIRFEENVSRLGNALTEFSGQYKFANNWSLSAAYRFGERSKLDYFESRQRVQLGIGYKYKLENWQWAYSLRFQKSIHGEFAESDPDFETVMRNKVTVKYTKIRKWDLSLSAEIFHDSESGGGLTWQNWRLKCEVEHKLNKRNLLSGGYLIQKDLMSSVPTLDYIFLVSYTHIIKKKKE